MCIGTNNIQDPYRHVMAEGSYPQLHPGEPECTDTEPRDIKYAQTCSVHITLDNSRVLEGPTPLERDGTRAQAVCGGEPNYIEL